MVVRYPMVGTQRRRLSVRWIKPLLAVSVAMSEGVSRMASTHPMVSTDAKGVERDVEADAMSTHGLDRGVERD